MRTVATVLRTGGHYTAEWVTRLERGARRFLQPDRFVCLTDAKDVGCERIALINRWPGWWAKLELWRPDLFEEGLVFYIDLDTLILQDFQEVWDYQGEFASLRDFTHPHIYASGLLLFRPNVQPLYRIAVQESRKVGSRQLNYGRLLPTRRARRQPARRFLNPRHRMDPWWNQYIVPDVLQDLYPGAIAHSDLDPCAACNGKCERKIVCMHGQPGELCDRLLGAWYS